MGLKKLGISFGLFLFFISISESAGSQTTLSYCPKQIFSKRFVAQLQSRDLALSQMVKLFHDFQKTEIQWIAQGLVPELEELQEQVRLPYIGTDARKALAERIRDTKGLMEAAKIYEVNEEDHVADMEALTSRSPGEALVRFVRYTANTEVAEIGIDLSFAEEARALLTAGIRKQWPEAVVNYIPIERDTHPPEQVQQLVKKFVRVLGGKEPSEVLMQKLWSRPLVRDGLYSDSWGRMEFYWELVQRNSARNLLSEQDLKNISRIVDKIEEMLRRPVPDAAPQATSVRNQ